MMLVDARKVYPSGICEDDVYIELLEECGLGPDKCGKLNYWLYGLRPAAATWEKLYSEKIGSVGFQRGLACGVLFYHADKDLALEVHGDDFTFCGLEEDLRWIAELMGSWFDIKIRGMVGNDPSELKEITISGRTLRYTERGVEFHGGS